MDWAGGLSDTTVQLYSAFEPDDIEYPDSIIGMKLTYSKNKKVKEIYTAFHLLHLDHDFMNLSDTIGIYSRKYNYYRLPDKLIQFLQDNNAKFSKYKIVLTLKWLRIVISVHGIFITFPSIPTLINGHSLMNGVKNSHVIEMFNKLTEIMGVNLLGEFYIHRIDLAYNLEVEKQVSKYLTNMYDLPRFIRKKESDSSIRFQGNGKVKGKGKVLAFYDKVKQMEDKGYVVPDEFKSINELRAEFRLLRNVTQWAKKKTTLGEALSLKFHDEVKNEMIKNLRALNTIPKGFNNFYNIFKPTDLKNACLAYCISNTYLMYQILNSIEELREQKLFQKGNGNNMLKLIRDTSRQLEPSETALVVKEIIAKLVS